MLMLIVLMIAVLVIVVLVIAHDPTIRHQANSARRLAELASHSVP
ncbi:MAG: hypothetical protein OEW29_01520 [Acidimicrobiia bacterium]|nr:hypothetical protein [Acidimicrobiia bacterium]